jgi:hypothetical protein
MWSSLMFCSCFLVAQAAVPETGETIPEVARQAERHDDFAGVDFAGVMGFARLNAGTYGLHYEHLFAGRHGLYLAFNGIHVHQHADHEQFHMNMFGGEIAYRFYREPGRGLFFGLAAEYRRGFGRRGERDAPDRVNYSTEQMALLPQVGYRWVLETMPLSFVARAGAGYGPYKVTAEDPGMIEDERFARDVLGATPIAIDLEFSLAYGF